MPHGSPTVTLVVMSATELIVSWTLVDPIERNGIITNYEILYQPLVIYDNISILKNSTELSTTLTMLHEFANYSVQVRAYTEVGSGPYSMKEFTQTLEAGLKEIFQYMNAYCVMSCMF